MSTYKDTRDEDVTLEYNGFHVVTDKYVARSSSWNGREISTWPRSINYITSGQTFNTTTATVDWTTATVDNTVDTFTTPPNTLLGILTPATYVLRMNTGQHWTFPQGGTWFVTVVFYTALVWTTDDAFSLAVQESYDSGATWIPLITDNVRQADQAAPLQPDINALSGSAQFVVPVPANPAVPNTTHRLRTQCQGNVSKTLFNCRIKFTRLA